LFAVFAGDDLRDAFGGPVVAADLEEGSDHGADHVVEEAAAFDGEDDEGASAVDAAGVHGAGGVHAFVGAAAEGEEIVGADEVGGGGLHEFDVEGAVVVIDVVAVEDGAVGVGPDQVAVAFVLGAADVKVGGYLFHVADEDVGGEAAVDGFAEADDVEGGGGVHGGDLAEGVDAGVGAGGAEDDAGVGDDGAGGFFDFALDGVDAGGFGLALPAVVGGAVVGDGEFVAFHDRGVDLNTKSRRHEGTRRRINK
jgi:hypothetical protein